VSPGRSHFYWAPDSRCEAKAFLVRGDSLVIMRTTVSGFMSRTCIRKPWWRPMGGSRRAESKRVELWECPMNSVSRESPNQALSPTSESFAPFHAASAARAS